MNISMLLHACSNCRPVALAILLMITGCSGFAAAEPKTGQEQSSEKEVRGPNGGLLLKDGGFSIEVTIFESGRPPQFRVFAYSENQPVDPTKVDLKIELGRLGGKVDQFVFKAEGDYLAGDGVVYEPHSFDVTVKAEYGGRSYEWSYPSYEGRTTITAEAAREAGVKTEPVGPAKLTKTINVLGRIAFASGAKVSLRGRFPGQVLKVFKTVGDRVEVGDVLAQVESNKSLKTYEVSSPIAGIVLKRLTNPGDVTNSEPLFVVADPKRLHIDFHVFSSDLGEVRPGQTVKITTFDGRVTQETKIATFLPTEESSTPIVIARAPLPDPDGDWIPGMTVRGDIVVSEEKVPRAVRTQALQRFRDFTVVFAKVGDTYEVRMLELGRRSHGWSEVLGGIDPGQEYVVENSFLIKADIEKSGASHDH